MTEMTKIEAAPAVAAAQKDAPDLAALVSKLVDETQRTNLLLKAMAARLEQVEAATVITAYAHSKNGYAVMSAAGLARRQRALEVMTKAEG